MPCDDILRFGLGNNYRKVVTKQSLSQSFREALSYSYDEARSAKKDKESGLGFVYDSMGLDFDSGESREDFENLKEQYFSDKYGMLQKNFELALVDRHANPSVVEAWKDCMTGRKISAFVIDSNLDEFLLSVTYTPRERDDAGKVKIRIDATGDLCPEKHSVQIDRFGTCTMKVTKAQEGGGGTLVVTADGNPVENKTIVVPKVMPVVAPVVIKHEFKVMANASSWTSTGISVPAGCLLRITAGTDNWSLGWGAVNAAGHTSQKDPYAGSPICPNFQWGALVGRVKSEIFCVGLACEMEVQDGGVLELAMNDNPNHPVGYSDNTGYQIVSIEIHGDGGC